MDLDKIAAKVVEAGGGMSESALYGRIRRALLSGIRDIERNFINVSLKYGDREVNGTVDGHTVKFFYNIQRASNGEVAGLPVLVVDGKVNKNFYGKISGELAKMLKETGGKAASVKTAKINQKGYRYWVVVDGKIESGWEHAQDAKDQLENLPAGKKGKVLMRLGLTNNGLDPDDDKAWHHGYIASDMTKVAGELVRLAKEMTGVAGRDALNYAKEVYEVELKPEHAVSLSREIQNARQKANRNREVFSSFDMMAVVEKFLDDKGYKFHRQVTKKASFARELVKIAKELVGAAGPLTLLEELKSNIHKLDDDKFLKMTSHGWGYTPGVDYIYGMAGNDIAHAIVGYDSGHSTMEKVQKVVKENIDEALKDNQPFKGLRGEQQETRDLWFELMKRGKKGK